LYTIHVHALKNATANIGANKLSHAAKDLEMAGKNSDLSFIETHNGDFVADLELLLNDIHNSLSERKKNGGDENASMVDMDDLKNNLVQLKNAIETLEASRLNSILDVLHKSKLPESVGTTIKNISKCILIADYDEALELTESLLEEDKNGERTS